MIIGVSGKIGSGKDTFAQFVCKLHGSYRILKYSSALKRVAGILAGVDPGLFEDQEFKASKMPPEWGDMTYREFLVKLGTEAVRDNVHQDAWVIAFWNAYTGSNCLITDTRFINEAEAIKARGGIIVRIARKGDRTMGHQSETELDDWNFDHVIRNDGTLRDLLNNTEEFCNKFIR